MTIRPAYLSLVLTTLVTALSLPAANAARPAKDLLNAPLPYQNKPVLLGSTVWYCAYGGAASIFCRLGDAGSSEAQRFTQTVSARLPQAVHEILNTPAALADDVVRIPLLTVPQELDLVGELAEAVMCGTKPMCSVIFGESPARLGELVMQYETTRLSGASLGERLAVASLY